MVAKREGLKALPFILLYKALRQKYNWSRAAMTIQGRIDYLRMRFNNGMDNLMTRLKQAGTVLLPVIAGLLLIHTFGLSRLTPEAIKELIISLGWWGPVLYIFFYTIRPLLLFPALILTLAGGLAFGPFWGTVYVLAGGLGGALLCFVLARSFARDMARRHLKDKAYFKAVENRIEQQGFKGMLFLRLMPVFPYDPISCLAGLTSIRLTPYLLATLIGMLPGALAYNMLGCSLTDLFSPQFYLGVALVVITLLSPFLYQFVRSRQS